MTNDTFKMSINVPHLWFKHNLCPVNKIIPQITSWYFQNDRFFSKQAKTFLIAIKGFHVYMLKVVNQSQVVIKRGVAPSVHCKAFTEIC